MFVFFSFFSQTVKEVLSLETERSELYLTTALGKLWIKAGISIPLATSLQTDKKQLDALALSKQRKMKMKKIGRDC